MTRAEAAELAKQKRAELEIIEAYANGADIEQDHMFSRHAPSYGTHWELDDDPDFDFVFNQFRIKQLDYQPPTEIDEPVWYRNFLRNNWNYSPNGFLAATWLMIVSAKNCPDNPPPADFVPEWSKS
jgi:hypothetical protein